LQLCIASLLASFVPRHITHRDVAVDHQLAITNDPPSSQPHTQSVHYSTAPPLPFGNNTAFLLGISTTFTLGNSAASILWQHSHFHYSLKKQQTTQLRNNWQLKTKSWASHAPVFLLLCRTVVSGRKVCSNRDIRCSSIPVSGPCFRIKKEHCSPHHASYLLPVPHCNPAIQVVLMLAFWPDSISFKFACFLSRWVVVCRTTDGDIYIGECVYDKKQGYGMHVSVQVMHMCVPNTWQ
jgi:hypothetical protein